MQLHRLRKRTERSSDRDRDGGIDKETETETSVSARQKPATEKEISATRTAQLVAISCRSR